MKTILWIIGILFMVALVAWIMGEKEKDTQPSGNITNPEAKALLDEVNASTKALTDAANLNTGYTVNNDYKITQLQNNYAALLQRVKELEEGGFA